MAKLIILSETTKQITEKAYHASRAGGSKSSFTCNCLLLHEAFNYGCARRPTGGFCLIWLRIIARPKHCQPHVVCGS